MDEEANGRSGSTSRTLTTIFQLPAMVQMSVAVHFPLSEIQSSVWWGSEGCEVFYRRCWLGGLGLSPACSIFFSFLLFLLLFSIWMVLGLNICFFMTTSYELCLHVSVIGFGNFHLKNLDSGLFVRCFLCVSTFFRNCEDS